MKTIQDTNCNYANKRQQNFSSSVLPTNTRQNLITSNDSVHRNSTTAIDSDANTYSSLMNQNDSQQKTIFHTTNGSRVLWYKKNSQSDV